MIRVNDCTLLIKSNETRCLPCNNFRKNNLFTIKKRKLSTEEADIHCPNIHLNRDQLEKKTAFVKKEANYYKAVNKRLQKKVWKVVKNESIPVQKDIHDLLEPYLKTKISENSFEKDSPQHLLWEEQKRVASLKNKKSVRWHPLMIRWCLSIFISNHQVKSSIIFLYRNIIWKIFSPIYLYSNLCEIV